MVWKASIKAGILREFLDRPKSILDDFKAQIDKNGLVVQAVDPAHVCMVDCVLMPKAFENFTFDEEKPIEIPVIMEHINTIWRNITPAGFVEIQYPIIETVEYTPEKKNTMDKPSPIKTEIRYLRITYGDIVKDILIRDYDLDGYVTPKIPKLQFTNKFSIQTPALMKIIKEIEAVSDHLIVKSIMNGILIDSGTQLPQENVRVHRFFPIEKLEGFFHHSDTKTIFSLDYLSNLVRSLTHVHHIELEIKTDHPVRVSWDQTYGQEIIGKGYFLLAPRLESD